MIRWCCYCQSLMSEGAPLTSDVISHGICRRCEIKLDAGEPLIERYDAISRFYRELFSAAREGDRRTCVALARRAERAGIAPVDVLVGLIQPALVKIGDQWELGLVTVADEHRFTAWCEAMLATLTWPEPLGGPLDLLIVQAPGNVHDLGGRIAERVLRTHGIRAETASRALDADALIARCRADAPAWVGFSCAMPPMIDASLALAATLVADGYAGGVMLSGQAVRRDPDVRVGAGVAVCPTIEAVRERILATRGPATAGATPV